MAAGLGLGAPVRARQGRRREQPGRLGAARDEALQLERGQPPRQRLHHPNGPLERSQLDVAQPRRLRLALAVLAPPALPSRRPLAPIAAAGAARGVRRGGALAALGLVADGLLVELNGW